MVDEAQARGGFELGSLSDEQLRELRKAASDELRRRGVLPPKEEKSNRSGGGKGKRKSGTEDFE